MKRDDEIEKDQMNVKSFRKEWETPTLNSINVEDTLFGGGSPADTEGPDTLP